MFRSILSRHFCLLFVVVVLLHSAVAIADDTPFIIDGEPFTVKFEANPPSGSKLIEYIREGETFDKWTKLIGLRYEQLPGAGNEPRKIAEAMATVVKAHNPASRSSVLENKQASEAMIDFITWPPDGKFMEFNIFRYAKSTDGNGIVSLQFAYRFTDKSPQGLENIKRIRASWIQQSAAYDMKAVRDRLGK